MTLRKYIDAAHLDFEGIAQFLWDNRYDRNNELGIAQENNENLSTEGYVLAQTESTNKIKSILNVILQGQEEGRAEAQEQNLALSQNAMADSDRMETFMNIVSKAKEQNNVKAFK